MGEESEILWLIRAVLRDHVQVGNPLEPTRPFRWDVTRRECLGSLVARPGEDLWYLEELEACAAKVLARCGNGRRVYFVGRSPASICDYLTGALENTSWAHRLVRLPFSMRGEDDRRRVLGDAGLRRQLQTNLGALGLHPHDLQRGRGGVAFVDLVAHGGTFANLAVLLHAWTAEVGAQWDVVRRRLRFVAITTQQQPYPGLGRLQDQAAGLEVVPRSAVTQIPIHGHVWGHLGGRQAKVERCFHHRRWGEVDGPIYEDEVLDALATAVTLVELGRTPPARSRLAALVAAEQEFCERWLRALVAEMRGVDQTDRSRRRAGLGRPWTARGGAACY
ncbi:MAG: hypothetical protein M3P34_04745 [Actinomycetota bacterium]|nr:hypothetical protein [Actinomycetota bacterium]